MILRNGTITNLSDTVTGLRKTSDIAIGMFVYGNGVPVKTAVKTIIDNTSIKMDKVATLTATQNLQITPLCPDVLLDRIYGLKDVQNMINERGEYIKVILRQESQVTRDGYNSIEKRNQETVYWMKAYPINFSPSAKQIEKAGLREQNNVLIYTAMQSWIDVGVDFEDIEFEGRTTIMLRNQEYEIREKGLESQLGDTFGYVTLGVFKR